MNTTLLGGFNTPNATLGSADSDKTVLAIASRNSIIKGGVVSKNTLLSEVRLQERWDSAKETASTHFVVVNQLFRHLAGKSRGVLRRAQARDRWQPLSLLDKGQREYRVGGQQRACISANRKVAEQKGRRALPAPLSLERSLCRHRDRFPCTQPEVQVFHRQDEEAD